MENITSTLIFFVNGKKVRKNNYFLVIEKMLANLEIIKSNYKYEFGIAMNKKINLLLI